MATAPDELGRRLEKAPAPGPINQHAVMVYALDGDKIVDVDSFYDEVSAKMLPGVQWGRNLDAFNDILRGGFGTPECGFVLQWISSAASRVALGSALFDSLVEIVRDHGRDGQESGDRVELWLE